MLLPLLWCTVEDTIEYIYMTNLVIIVVFCHHTLCFLPTCFHILGTMQLDLKMITQSLFREKVALKWQFFHFSNFVKLLVRFKIWSTNKKSVALIVVFIFLFFFVFLYFEIFENTSGIERRKSKINLRCKISFQNPNLMILSIVNKDKIFHCGLRMRCYYCIIKVSEKKNPAGRGVSASTSNLRIVKIQHS